MSITIGTASGGGPHLQPSSTTPKQPLAGAYSVIVGAVLSRRGQRFPSAGLTVGLLTGGPAPEGRAYQEVAGPDYARQPVELASLSTLHDANAAPVSFGPVAADWPVATHLGVFDAEGSLVGYGALVPMGYRYEIGCIAFDAAAIRFKRPLRP